MSKRFSKKKFLGEVIGYDPETRWFKVYAWLFFSLLFLIKRTIILKPWSVTENDLHLLFRFYMLQSIYSLFTMSCPNLLLCFSDVIIVTFPLEVEIISDFFSSQLWHVAFWQQVFHLAWPPQYYLILPTNVRVNGFHCRFYMKMEMMRNLRKKNLIAFCFLLVM